MTTTQAYKNAIVQKFERGMIKTTLKSMDLHYLEDQDGDFLLRFSDDAEIGCELSIWLTAEGESGSICVVRGVADKPVPHPDWGKALQVCNSWNQEKRWPRAYLNIADSKDATANIVLEESLDLEPGIHQELLNTFIAEMIGGAIMFWKWAHQEKSF